MSKPHPAPLILAVFAAVALLLAGARPAGAVWNGSDLVMPGDGRTASFDGSDDPPYHAYWFFALQNSALSFSIKPGKTGNLQTSLALFTDLGAAVTLGAAQTGPNAIASFLIPSTGWYALRVNRVSGTGDYALATKGKLPKLPAGTDGTGSIHFSAAAGSVLSISAKASTGSAAIPTFSALLGPSGAVTIPAGLASLKGIVLPLTGDYELQWANGGGAGTIGYKIAIKAAKSVRKKVILGDTDSAPELGDPSAAVAPEAGYAGSGRCGMTGCHQVVYESFAATYHGKLMRRAGHTGAGGYAIPATMDALFKANTNLVASRPAAFGTYSGLSLGYQATDSNPYKITVGSTTYDVLYVIGGNGEWKQLYVVKIGNSHYIAPIQFNDADDSLSAYLPGNWFDGGGAAKGSIARNTSWELNCAGCHATGLAVRSVSGEYQTGYVQLNPGCESCHGPALDHANSQGARTLVTNPESLLDGTVNGVLAADLLCGRCHTSGTGGIPAGGADHAGYPLAAGGGTFPLGNTDIDSYFDVTTDPTSWWRVKDNPLGSATPGDPSDDTRLAARANELQYPEFADGVHGPRETYSPTCFSCHDPHGGGEGQIRSSLTEGGTTFTGVTADNNKLCLSCHKGFGDYAALSASDVQSITDTSAPAAVVNAVVDHMKDKAAMPIETAAYAPAATGVGRCTGCHMVKTAKSAVYTADAAGHSAGDIHGHTFRTVWPNISALTKADTDGNGITNSCSACHPVSAGDAAADAIAQWAEDGTDGDGRFHAGTPDKTETGVVNPNRSGGVACVACHTTEGFLSIQVNGSLNDLTGGGDATARADMLKRAIGRDMGITCEACHGKQAGGTFAAGANALRFAKAQLCGRCHNNQTIVYSDWQAYGEVVNHPQREMLAGTSGAEVAGQTYSGTTAIHTSAVSGDCTACHFRAGDSSREHTFEPTIAACNACHGGGITTFDRVMTGKDYDGDTLVEGVQTEVDGCLAILKAAILAKVPSDPLVTVNHDGTNFVIGKVGTALPGKSNTFLLNATNDGPQLRAMFNYDFVLQDGSRGVHNTRYALRLIQKSYTELTGLAWPGTVK